MTSAATAIAAGVYQALNRSMKRAVGALLDCAASTMWMMRAMVLSAAPRVTCSRSTPPALMLPA